MKRNGAWLELKNISSCINDKKVLKNISFNINHGEHTAILGPNGAGKSALIKLISREIYPLVTNNSYMKLFGNERINLETLRKKIGIVSDDIHIRTSKNTQVRNLVLSGLYGSIGLSIKQKPINSHVHKAEEVLKKLELSHLACKCYGELSDGQKKRVLVARAIIHHPQVLILDEPSNSLDIRAKANLIGLIRKLCGFQTSLLLVTHSVETIVDEIERVIFINEGSVSDDGSMQEMLVSDKLSKLYDTPLKIINSKGYRQLIPIQTDDV